jgi:hypothetical protein
MIGGQLILTTAQILPGFCARALLQHLFYPKDRIHSPYRLIEVTKKVANVGGALLYPGMSGQRVTTDKETHKHHNARKGCSFAPLQPTQGPHPPRRLRTAAAFR